MPLPERHARALELAHQQRTQRKAAALAVARGLTDHLPLGRRASARKVRSQLDLIRPRQIGDHPKGRVRQHRLAQAWQRPSRRPAPRRVRAEERGWVWHLVMSIF